jgi:hypothetical protein
VGATAVRGALLISALAGLLEAQMPTTEPLPHPDSPLVTGVLLERDSGPAHGEFAIRAADNQVFRYRFDDKTYVERDDAMISVPRLQAGEKVEVLSDQVDDGPLRYARTVHVVETLPPVHRRRMMRHEPNWTENLESDPLFARGDMAISGVIAQLTPGRMVLHTRDGERTILLRHDTRYLENGEVVDLAALAPNLRVFVRAGKNIYNEVEGFQVVWGKILNPK